MIGRLKGIVAATDEDTALIDVGGVGYEVFCPASALAALSPGQAAELVIETHVREDHIHLYGFESAAGREWFRLLTSVQRVGAKMALSILSIHAPEALASAIIAKDQTAFSRISGIGPKLAERIVAELKDKALKAPVDGGQRTADKSKPASPKPQAASHLEDAVSALANLGYSRSEAYAAASRNAEEGARLDDIIRQSLKELGRAKAGA